MTGTISRIRGLEARFWPVSLLPTNQTLILGRETVRFFPRLKEICELALPFPPLLQLL
jgi:hypothetical protein